MRKLASLLAVAAVGVFAADASSASRTISLKDDFFSPKSASVSRNTTVVFRFAGRKAHNVVVTKGPVKFRSPTKASGTYSRKMTRKGTYTLVCTLHPGMNGKLTVR